jgi:cbb3-type cytochrome oxidase subunit 3
VSFLDPYRANNPPSLVLEINQAYRDEMTGDTFTLVVLLAGGFVVFLGAIWFIEWRGSRASRQRAKRERRKFKL